MKRITIIYWSSTGNTQKMAEAIAEGAMLSQEEKGLCVRLLHVSEAKKTDITESDVLALGCSAMSVESIDESEMLPFITNHKNDFEDKGVLLFGSYDWGDGEWMEEWQSDMEGHGAKIIGENLMINLMPDEEGLRICRSYGGVLQSYLDK